MEPFLFTQQNMKSLHTGKMLKQYINILHPQRIPERSIFILQVNFSRVMDIFSFSSLIDIEKLNSGDSGILTYVLQIISASLMLRQKYNNQAQNTLICTFYCENCNIQIKQSVKCISYTITISVVKTNLYFVQNRSQKRTGNIKELTGSNEIVNSYYNFVSAAPFFIV